MEDDEISTREQDEYVTRRRRRRRRRRRWRKRCKCNMRLHELATPQKRMFLALWNEHAHNLPPDKVDKLKELLQLYYAMTPEETAKYFAELRAQAKAAAQRRKLKQKLRKYLLNKRNQKQKEKAYALFKKILKSGIRYAASTQVPPLVSIRLRYLSDIILEQLCVLRRLSVPNRGNTDDLGNFLISVADWMAIAVERLYYSTQLTVNEMTADIYEQQQQPDNTELIAPGPPVASSTPRSSIESRRDSQGEPDKTSRRMSEMSKRSRRMSQQSQNQQVSSQRRNSRKEPDIASRKSVDSKISKRSRRKSQQDAASRTDKSDYLQKQSIVDSARSSIHSADSLSNGSIKYDTVRPYYSIIEPSSSAPVKIEVKSYNPQDMEQILTNFEKSRTKKGKTNTTENTGCGR